MRLRLVRGPGQRVRTVGLQWGPWGRLARAEARGAAAEGERGARSRGTARREKEDGPDRWAPPVSGRSGDGAASGWRRRRAVELGRRKGNGNRPAMGFWAAGRKRKRREREKDWAGRAKICWAENVFPFSFLKTKQTNSIQIQTQRFEFKIEPQTITNARQHGCTTTKQLSLIL